MLVAPTKEELATYVPTTYKTKSKYNFFEAFNFNLLTSILPCRKTHFEK
jgi:hypothetical protein